MGVQSIDVVVYESDHVASVGRRGVVCDREGAQLLGSVASAYSGSNSFVKDLAAYLVASLDYRNWSSASDGLANVSSQLKELFRRHLGKVIVKAMLN